MVRFSAVKRSWKIGLLAILLGVSEVRLGIAAAPDEEALLTAVLNDDLLRIQGGEPREISLAERGRVLFAHEWAANAGTGDGLGLMFNANSCLACHHQGGPGGGGTAKSNVDLLTSSGQGAAERVHSGFSGTSPVVVLHKFGLNAKYDEFRSQLLGPKLVNHQTGLVTFKIPQPKQPPIQLTLSHRNTPALFGAGLIDGIPASVIINEAKRQAASRSPIAGKVAATAEGVIGRFGWRGQTATLRGFVMGACSNEVGLQVPGEKQPPDPLNPNYSNLDFDLSIQQCDSLVTYVASLAPVPQHLPLSNQEAANLRNGGRLFENIGCARCHLPKLGNVDGIYSDLLLHDLGERLADPVGARVATASEIDRVLKPDGDLFKQQIPRGAGYFGGGSPQIAQPQSRLWRTPPLWGVRASAPYLHDGRAETLLQAVLLHGGEAQECQNRFQALPADAQRRLLGFVLSLGFPQPQE